jgi:signal transduction histidine kinase
VAVFALISLAMVALAAERRRAEASAHEAHAFLQSTLDSLSARIAVIDGAGTIVAANAAWRLAAAVGGGAPGWPGDVGTSYLDAWCARRAGTGGDAIRAGVAEVLGGHRPEVVAEYAVPCGGERRWLEVRARLFEGAGPVRAVVSHEDVTERAQARETERRAETAGALARLARAAAHEINNPLAILLGNVEFVAGDLPAETRARIRPMLDAIERIRRVVSRMSRLGHLEPCEAWPGASEIRDLPRPDTATGVR